MSAVEAFYQLLSQSSLNVLHPEEKKPVAPVELCPILRTLYKILITGYVTDFAASFSIFGIYVLLAGFKVYCLPPKSIIK